MSVIALALLERAKENISAADDYIAEYFGSIEIVRARVNEGVEEDLMMDVSFVPVAMD